MKKLINYWPALTGFAFTFLIAVLVTSWTPAKAQSQERKGRAVVYISAFQSWHNSGYGRDLLVEYISASDGVTVVEFGTPMGKALAFYMDQGFRLEPRPTWSEWLLVR